MKFAYTRREKVGTFLRNEEPGRNSVTYRFVQVGAYRMAREMGESGQNIPMRLHN